MLRLTTPVSCQPKSSNHSCVTPTVRQPLQPRKLGSSSIGSLKPTGEIIPAGSACDLVHYGRLDRAVASRDRGEFPSAGVLQIYLLGGYSCFGGSFLAATNPPYVGLRPKTKGAA